ncbi:unnamed protein product [Adineta ricciae]|uniref:Cell division control protein 45-like protein n=2 Tax=Adineta ricciae TaxID=249248 RepID=A0A815NKW5_ADIRI|nr:unnamed protein product [Adineta ricciae]
MVFIRDLKREFFEFISKQQRRLLVFVHLDVDSLCAWKIFQHLLQCEHITYTCLPVLYKYDLENGHMQHINSGIKSMIFINCGSTLDLYDFLSLDSIGNDDNALTLFVLDSLRPIEHRNVYDAKQIRILILPNKIDAEKKRVPQYEELFHEVYDDDNNDENESENEDNDDDDDDGSNMRIESTEGREKRLKRQWLKKRDKALGNYYKYRSHSYSSALVMFELAYLLSKDTNEQLWYAIIGTHVLRLNHHQNTTRSITDENNPALNTSNSKLSMDCVNIKFDEDINFHLLRHWSFYDSICHTQDMILAFKLWSSRGLAQLKEFLADLGIPKREYEQNYRDMNIKYKVNIKKQILDKRLQDKYHYTTNTIILPTFLLSSGFTLKLSPQDIVLSIMATLQTASSSSSTSTSMMIDLTERFSLALSCLNYHQLTDYLGGIELEKVYMNKTHYLIETLLQSDKNLSFDNTIPFILLKFDQNMFNSSTTTDHTTSCGFFTHPYQAYLFARNALQTLIAYTSASSNAVKKKKSKHLQRLPLILIAPYSSTNSGEELVEIVVGVPSLNSIMMNSFSTLFEAADRRCGNVAKFVFFDHSVLLLQEQHQQKFIDALMFVLAK